MLKICLCSDNHGDLFPIQKILDENPACDYYFHCGDSCVSPEEIEPFISVQGNNDWDYDYPKFRRFEIGGHRIYLFHGTGYTYSEKLLLAKAKQEKADLVFYGHSHVFTDKMIGRVRFINPGSCWHNRDGTEPSYARIYLLDDGTVKAERVNV